MKATVKILVKGYFKWLSENKLKASSNIVLVRDGDKNIIVDTGNEVVESNLLKALKEENLKPEDIDIVINTHSHSDHRGNNHLFKKAVFYVYANTIKKDVYEFFPVVKSMQVTTNTKIVQAVGHTKEDISLIVETKEGFYAITGDLFKDQENDVEFCDDEIKLQESQTKIKALSDYIVPGHGEIFKPE